MNLYIKNMVCNRCRMVVKNELEKVGIEPLNVQLGEVELAEKPSAQQMDELKHNLADVGFELIDTKKGRIIEKIKNVVIDLIHHSEDQTKLKYSEYLSEKLNHDYSYLSKLFSEVEGKTIEQYIISQKIEKVKELLVYDELSLSEIAWQLGYSSVAHLSAQFKKVTGLTPSFYKDKGMHHRKPLDGV
ncbi:helix-turn-helix domain-containing protein [Polluticoccus soli]|uniref:helix-turn-helix domain-containing protein n=1 Tax=Polluticoccus soli TaxID=3034150 RepID=UPI0023E185EF|nr:helix-turn-helix transcriptional regulator [Flavipsychrobacter sp. JY13-12]